MKHIDIRGHLQNLLALTHLNDFEEIDRIHEIVPTSTKLFTIRMIMSGGRCSSVGLRLLAHLTSDESPEVRAAALDTLRRHGGDFPEWLVKNMAELLEPDPWVELFRIRFFQTCITSHENHVMDALNHSATFPQIWVQFEVIRTLERISCYNKTEISRHIMSWLSASNSHGKETALRFLSSNNQFVDTDVLESVFLLSHDPSHLVRKSCAIILSKHIMMQPERIIGRLKSMADDSSHWSVRLAVVRGVSRWYTRAPLSALEIIKCLIRDPIRIVRTQSIRNLRNVARMYPALTMEAVRKWHTAQETDTDALNACMEEVLNSEDQSAEEMRYLREKELMIDEC